MLKRSLKVKADKIKTMVVREVGVNGRQLEHVLELKQLEILLDKLDTDGAECCKKLSIATNRKIGHGGMNGMGPGWVILET